MRSASASEDLPGACCHHEIESPGDLISGAGTRSPAISRQISARGHNFRPRAPQSTTRKHGIGRRRADMCWLLSGHAHGRLQRAR